jgi:hypothetical protein
MSPKMLLPLSAALLFIASCRPKPLDIDIPQSSGVLSIASYCPDNHSVYVSASYSVSAMLKVLDTAALKYFPDVTESLLLKEAVVTLRNPDNTIDTLRKLSPGIYKRDDLQLLAGQSYTLTVLDPKKGILATATTSYQPIPTMDTLYPALVKRTSDTTCRLHLQLRNASAPAYFFLSYNTVRQAREHTSALPKNARALSLFLPKQIALFSPADAPGGNLEKDIILQVNPSDTVLVQVAQIDKAYYDYLSAYKRTGSLINQLTGEPIHLPSNISSGYGYFSLFNPVKRLYDLNRY